MGLAWSPLALLAVVAMIFISLALLVALLVMGALGRFRRWPPPDEDLIPPAGLPISGVTFTLPPGAENAVSSPGGEADAAEGPGEEAVPAPGGDSDTPAVAAGHTAPPGEADGAPPAGDTEEAHPVAKEPAHRRRFFLPAARLFGRKAEPEDAPARRTGLSWLLAGLLLPLPAVLAFARIDNPRGPMQMLTPGAAACFLLLGAQAACCIFLIRAQRRL